jgi:hypothetical protein
LLLAACSDDSQTDTPATADTSGDTSGDTGGDTTPATESDRAIDDETDAVTSDAPQLDQPFTLSLFEDTVISSDVAAQNFQRARADADWGSGPFTQVTLIVALETTCYPFEEWQAEDIPDGHNYPASCDAYDRNFEFTLDEPQQLDDPPAIELVRAITPFGGPLSFEIDVTDIANGLPGPHTIDVMIATWSDSSGQQTGAAGQWTVSASLEVVPGASPRNVVAVIPLVNGSQGLTDVAEHGFVGPADATTVEVQYRVTGHGGAVTSSDNCIGGAEEFCQRTHEIYFDGEHVDTVVPWRDNCEDLCTITRYGSVADGFDYCLENPTGLIASVQAPRANWCPGSVTPPLTWHPTELTQDGELFWVSTTRPAVRRVSAHTIFYRR